MFRAGPGGPALATAVLGLSGCEYTGLTMSGKAYGLGKYASGRSTAARVLQAAGVGWTIPPMQWPASA